MSSTGSGRRRRRFTPEFKAEAVAMVREAGGTVTALDGGRYDHHGRPCLASNGPLHPALVQALRDGPDEPS